MGSIIFDDGRSASSSSSTFLMERTALCRLRRCAADILAVLICLVRMDGMVSVCLTTSLFEKERREEEDENLSLSFFCCTRWSFCLLCIRSGAREGGASSVGSNEKFANGSSSPSAAEQVSSTIDDDSLTLGVILTNASSKLATSVSDDR